VVLCFRAWQFHFVIKTDFKIAIRMRLFTLAIANLSKIATFIVSAQINCLPIILRRQTAWGPSLGVGSMLELIYRSDRLNPYSCTLIRSLPFADDLSLLKGCVNGIKKNFTIS
jgi:hypothetical protein